MIAGYRVVDMDSYVCPAVELLYEQGAGEFRGRWDTLKHFLRLKEHPRTDLGDWRDPSLEIAVVPSAYDRPFGGKTVERAIPNGAGHGTPAWADAEPHPDAEVEEGVLHDNSAGRLRLLDDKGIDLQLIAPGPVPWMSTELSDELSLGLLEAYNRYISTYCEVDDERLKAVALVHGGDAEWSAGEIRRIAGERCVAAVALCLPNGVPLDDPDLHPIWQAMVEADLPLFHHAYIEGWPYFPGYRDLWDNVVVARAAAHQWSAQRALAFLVYGGIFDRYPQLRVGFAGSGAGWLPSWLCQVRGQARTQPHRVPAMKRDPLDYAFDGHIYVGLEPYEGEAIAASVVDLVGDHALVWQSHFPYGDTNFPDSPDGVLSWSAGTEALQRKVLAENGERYLRII